MLFSSLPFLYYFLPITLALYLLVPKSIKNLVLLIASLFFYGWGEPKYVFLMLLSITAGYIFGLLIEKSKSQSAAKILLALSLIFNLGMLGIFKYTDFFISNFNAATGLSIPLLRIALPIGISFYTFQILSYTIDVYRKDVAAQKNIISLATYIALFPQLIAGPIVRYKDVEEQLKTRTHSIEKTALGIRRFVIGLAKKILIANQLGELCDLYLASSDQSVLFTWMYAISFMLHIYFDFSGYSDMAIGLGKLFGFEFMENFNYPFISQSITEFWRRWHISLGTWFKDYVYIPLGGNRVGKVRHAFNILTVWFLTGFWHGASWNFIVWGLYFALLLTLEKYWLLKPLKKHRILSHAYVLLLVMISFVIFNAVNLSDASEIIQKMFMIKSIPFISIETIYYFNSYAIILLIAVLGATPLPKLLINRINKEKIGSKILDYAEPLLLICLIIITTAYLVDGSFNPFLYFRF